MNILNKANRRWLITLSVFSSGERKRFFNFPNSLKEKAEVLRKPSTALIFRDLRRKKMTVYLSIAPKDLKIASLILNLFFNCAIRINLSENPDFVPELKYSLLLILDEFPSIGCIPYVKEAAGYIAGYKIQLLTIFQNVSQLNEIYGDQGRKTLLANSFLQDCFCA